MNRLFIILILATTYLTNRAQEPVSPAVNFPKPYEYKRSNDGFVVKSLLKFENSNHITSLIINGKELSFHVKNNGCIETFLPLVGETTPIQVSLNSKSSYIFRFTPLIPANWGYLGKGKVHIICSSHQDIAWMNTPDSCKHERVFDIVLPALNLIEENPEFKFEMEQTLNLMEAIEEAPNAKQRIIDAYKTGNFSWGATLTQPYEGLESGEQLVRQTYFGKKWITDKLPGMDAEVAYNIDVPGRSLQVPQILSKAGIKYLFVSRMKEGFYNWHSPDGTKILTYSPGNYGWSLLVYKYLEEDAITAMHKLSKVIKNWNEYYQNHNIPPHYAIVISTDAGGPKYYKEIISEWNKIAEEVNTEIPLIQHSTAEDFLGEIDVPEARFDSIYGERPNLWLYIHGAAHYQAIKAKKAAAVSVPAAEMFSTINCLLEDDFSTYPNEKLNKAWYSSIYPDHGWGGKNGTVTDSIFEAHLKTANKIGNSVLNESINKIASKIEFDTNNNILIFNDLAWNRQGKAMVDISDKKGDNWIIIDDKGCKIPSQLVKYGNKKELVFNAKDVPSIGYNTYQLLNKNNSDNKIKAGANFIENQFYEMTLGAGGITKLYDKQLKKEVLNTTRFSAGDLLHLGYNGNGAGEFTQITEPNIVGYEKLHEKDACWNLIGSGPVFTAFQSNYQMTGFEVIQKITVYHHKKQIDFEYNIPDWDGTHNRQLRVAFPLNMTNNAKITYDVPMGIVNVGEDELEKSPGGWAWGGTYRQKPEYIHPREIQNFMSVNDKDFGLTMSTNIVTADWIDPSREAVDYPVLQAILLSTHKSCHGLGNWYEQKGSHQFKISIKSHKTGWKNGYHFGIEENHPFIVTKVEQKQKGILPPQKSFISMNSDFLFISSFKKAENTNTAVLRVNEMEGKKKNVKVEFNWNIHELTKTNLIEEEPVTIPYNENYMKSEIGKYGIETFKLKLN